MKYSHASLPRAPFIRVFVLALFGACAATASQAANTWVTDPSDFPSSPLCESGEVTLWTCTARRKTFSLCAENGAVSHGVAIQYRVQDAHGKIVLRYPEPSRAAKTAFSYECSANGDADVEFTIGQYHYALVDPLRDVSFISVVKGGREVSHLRCRQGNQSLQLNDTIALMHALGVPEPN